MASTAGSEDPAVGLRAVAALRRLAEQSGVPDTSTGHATLGVVLVTDRRRVGRFQTGGPPKARRPCQSCIKGEDEMFERFTGPSRAVLVEAEDVAVEMGSDYISAGHILYGCADGREETAGRPLHDGGMTSASIRGRLPAVDVQPAGQVGPEALERHWDRLPRGAGGGRRKPSEPRGRWKLRPIGGSRPTGLASRDSRRRPKSIVSFRCECRSSCLRAAAFSPLGEKLRIQTVGPLAAGAYSASTTSSC